VKNLLGFPSSGIYVWVVLNRPTRAVSGPPLHLPLRLKNATILQQEGRPKLPEFRFQGRYRHQYQVMVGVDFGRAYPRRAERLDAQRALDAIMWPHWR
jgi:hypothetical protein